MIVEKAPPVKLSRLVKFKKGVEGFCPSFPSIGDGCKAGAEVSLSPVEYALAISSGLAEPVELHKVTGHDEPIKGESSKPITSAPFKGPVKVR